MALKLTRWWPHTLGGIRYSCVHLHPFDFDVRLEATDRHAARSVRVHVGFSSHCFTRKPTAADPDELLYTRGRDPRVLCPIRHELSKGLPDIIRGLERRSCFYAGDENYFVVELPSALPMGQEYWVFFDVRHIGMTDAVLLFVQSAYPNERTIVPRGRGRKKVGFRVLLNLALQNRRPKAPP